MDRSTAAFDGALETQLQALMDYPGFKGQTSNRFLAEISDLVIAKAEVGEPLIEVGCFLGKSTVALAMLARRMDARLFSIDVGRQHIDFTAGMLAHYGLADRVTFFHGDFPTFAARMIFPTKPAMVLVDGHHAYRYVRADIAALFALNDHPRYAAFHDYALRRAGPASEDAPNVYGAIHDAFGPALSVSPVGIAGPQGPPKINNRNNYLAPGVSEGVIIDLAPYQAGLPAPATA